MFNITDFTDTIQAKIFFLEPEVLESIGGELKNGKFIKLKGIPIFDTFSREIHDQFSTWHQTGQRYQKNGWISMTLKRVEYMHIHK